MDWCKITKIETSSNLKWANEIMLGHTGATQITIEARITITREGIHTTATTITTTTEITTATTTIITIIITSISSSTTTWQRWSQNTPYGIQTNNRAKNQKIQVTTATIITVVITTTIIIIVWYWPTTRNPATTNNSIIEQYLKESHIIFIICMYIRWY